VQQRAGKLLGIGRTKGASELNYEQYKVANFEAYYRAEGTTFDSHAFALYLAMSLPIPLAIALAPRMRRNRRIIAGIVAVLGLPGLIASFARAGWTAFAAACFVLVICLARWKQWRTMFLTGAVITIVAVPALLPFAKAIRTRLFDAPPELVSARVETVEMAMEIWRDHLWTGIGANGYMRDLEKKLSIFEGDPYFIPPHNMVVLVMTETGIIGLAVFLGFSVSIIRMGWKTVGRQGNNAQGVLASAFLAAFIAFQVEGIFDPIYVTNVTYFLFWLQLGIATALHHMEKEPETPGHCSY
jgi:O-antigen ligase